MVSVWRIVPDDATIANVALGIMSHRVLQECAWGRPFMRYLVEIDSLNNQVGCNSCFVSRFSARRVWASSSALCSPLEAETGDWTTRMLSRSWPGLWGWTSCFTWSDGEKLSAGGLHLGLIVHWALLDHCVSPWHISCTTGPASQILAQRAPTP